MKERGEVGKGRDFCEMVQSTHHFQEGRVGFDDKPLACAQGTDHLCRLEGGLAGQRGGGKRRNRVRGEEGEGWGRVRRARERGGERGWSVGEEE